MFVAPLLFENMFLSEVSGSFFNDLALQIYKGSKQNFKMQPLILFVNKGILVYSFQFIFYLA